MAVQPEIPLRYRDEDSSEPERERVALDRLLRAIADAVDEVGRKNVCYALGLTEQLLSKKLSGAEDKRPCFRILVYCVKHEKSGRLARAFTDYTGHTPLQREPELTPAERLSRLEGVLRSNPSVAAVVYGAAGLLPRASP